MGDTALGVGPRTHAMLPAITLAVLGTSTMRGSCLASHRDADSDYVAHRAGQGAVACAVGVVHAGRNALLPVRHPARHVAAADRVGAVIIERSSGAGDGRLAVEAISGLDLPVVMGIVFVGCAVVQLGNVAADCAVHALDPRQRRQE